MSCESYLRIDDMLVSIFFSNNMPFEWLVLYILPQIRTHLRRRLRI